MTTDAEKFAIKQKKMMYHEEMRRLHPFSLRVQLRVPSLNMELVREIFELPLQYCDACTLREGTIISLLILQTVAVLTMTCLGTLLYFFYDDTEYYWQEKFKEDFDPYLEDENKELVTSLWSMWDEVFIAIIIAEGSYFVTGLLVIYGLFVKNAHPAWYLPWLVETALLVACNFLISFVLFVVNCILGTFRYISVTYDIMPMILTFLYAMFWYYSWIIVIAHYKRRRIVKYWKDTKKFIGGDDF